MDQKKKKIMFFVLNGMLTMGLLVFGILSCVLGRNRGFGWHLGLTIALNVVNIIRFAVEAKLFGFCKKQN